MKKMICELCGSNDLQIEDNVVVCKSCGTKYSIEEAQKLINENEEEGISGTNDKTVAEKTGNSIGADTSANIKRNTGKKEYLLIVVIILLIITAAVYLLSTTSNCNVEGCSEKKIENGEYCSLHTCKYDGCTNYAGDSDYCSEHACKEDGCGEIGTIEGYCDKHALEQSDIPENLIEYAQNCGESTEDILKNFTYGGMFDMPGSFLDGCLKYYYKHTQGFYLVETEYPYAIYYAERENAGANLVWENGAFANEAF